MNTNDTWGAHYFKESKILQQLLPLTNLFKNFSDWPSISEYQVIFKQFNMKVIPVEQSQTIEKFEDQYEPRIYLKNELQTRLHNWHDFFNALIWLKFSQTKTTLNSLHYSQAISREKGSNRSLLENRITQFDECGAIIISNNNELLDQIRNHQWHDLFIKNREKFNHSLECVIFGHAIFEKALQPYIGMTCHCLLLNDDKLLNEAKQGNFKNIDGYLANFWEIDMSINPKKLHAFPLLGIPGYWNPQKNDFYNNTKYFR